MSNRERRIETIAILKSLIESGINKPDDEAEITAQQFLGILDRLAGPAEEETPTPVFTQPTQVPKGGGAHKLVELEDRGKYVRALIDTTGGARQWVSAWEKDAETLRRCGGAGATINAELKTSKDGKYVNLKDVEVTDDIPF